MQGKLSPRKPNIAGFVSQEIMDIVVLYISTKNWLPTRVSDNECMGGDDAVQEEAS